MMIPQLRLPASRRACPLSIGLLCLFFTLWGCSCKGRSRGDRSPDRLKLVEQATFRVKTTGAGPKQQLRYRFVAGRKTIVDLEMRLTASMTGAGRRLLEDLRNTVRLRAELEPPWRGYHVLSALVDLCQVPTALPWDPVPRRPAGSGRGISPRSGRGFKAGSGSLPVHSAAGRSGVVQSVWIQPPM